MREISKLLLLVFGLFLVGWVGYRLLFPTEVLSPLMVRQVEGSVSRVSGQGIRSDAMPGTSLMPLDRIETAADGRAVLTYGDESTVALQNNTSIRVLGVSSEGIRVELEGGRVEATVRPGRGRLGIVHRNQEVSGVDGTFAVATGEDGALAIESRKGAISVIGVDSVSGLQEGQRVMVFGDGTSQVGSIPESLLLEVAWPEAARTREAEVAVRGRTDPGAQVRVGAAGRWTTIMAGRDGRFEATLDLEKGANSMQVVSEDAMGRKATQEGQIVRDLDPPRGASFEVVY